MHFESILARRIALPSFDFVRPVCRAPLLFPWLTSPSHSRRHSSLSLRLSCYDSAQSGREFMEHGDSALPPHTFSTPHNHVSCGSTSSPTRILRYATCSVLLSPDSIPSSQFDDSCSCYVHTCFDGSHVRHAQRDPTHVAARCTVCAPSRFPYFPGAAFTLAFALIHTPACLVALAAAPLVLALCESIEQGSWRWRWRWRAGRRT
ncbi:hypothetical protein C8R45DRAFT_509396 [Mycena sanguinolenta]|nr:hypothetical protein C8R45DRAFT_509396 [Mycena sanguinolenta]